VTFFTRHLRASKQCHVLAKKPQKPFSRQKLHLGNGFQNQVEKMKKNKNVLFQATTFLTVLVCAEKKT